MTIQEAQLIKRTAWRNMQDRKPTKEDEKYIPKAVRMLTFIACLNYAMLDLGDELSEAGILRHAVKRRYNMAVEIVQRVTLSAPERAYNIVLALVRMIGSLNKELTCRYDFAPARELAAIPQMLTDCGIKDYGIDNILNVNIK